MPFLHINLSLSKKGLSCIISHILHLHKEVLMSDNEICETCKGKLFVQSKDEVDCRQCGGTGRFSGPLSMETCDLCEGEKKYRPLIPCSSCIPKLLLEYREFSKS